MKEIMLTKGKVAYVDDEDFEELSAHKWHYCHGYARRIVYPSSGERKNVLMHREIMKTPNGLVTDHINMNKLDNRKENLRIVTASQNSMNTKKLKRVCGSYFKGVTKDKKGWCAKINIRGKRYHIGYFKSQVMAAIAYDERAIELFGEYANINFSEHERELFKCKKVTK